MQGISFLVGCSLTNVPFFIGSPTAGAGGGTDEFILQNTKTSIYFPLRDRTIQSDAFGIEGYSVLPDVDESLESIKIIEMFENQ